MNYKTVDINTWSRGELFSFYMDRMRIVMSLTVDIDVTALAGYAKRNGLRFYPAMIWAVSKVVNAHEVQVRLGRGGQADKVGFYLPQLRLLPQ